MDTVNIFSQELRKTIRFDLESIKGCWIELYDDVTVNQIEKAQQVKDTESFQPAVEMLVGQLSNWNLADTNGKLDITVENLKRLPVKLITEISQLQAKAINPEAFAEKKSELASN